MKESGYGKFYFLFLDMESYMYGLTRFFFLNAYTIGRVGFFFFLIFFL